MPWPAISPREVQILFSTGTPELPKQQLSRKGEEKEVEKNALSLLHNRYVGKVAKTSSSCFLLQSSLKLLVHRSFQVTFFSLDNIAAVEHLSVSQHAQTPV